MIKVATLDTSKSEYIDSGVVAYPKTHELLDWIGVSLPTVFKRAAKRGNVQEIGLSTNTIKGLIRSNDGVSPRITKRSYEELMIFMRRLGVEFNALGNTPQLECKYDIALDAAALTVGFQLHSSILKHPPSYLGYVIIELFSDDITLINHSSTETLQHYTHLMPKTHSDLSNLNETTVDLVRRTDTACYLLAAQHAEFCHSTHAFKDYPRDLFIDLYGPPYVKGMFQERYFEHLRDLTENNTFSSLRLHPNDDRTLEQDSKSRKQINDAKQRNPRKISCDLSDESISKIFSHSIGMKQREHQEQIYVEGYRVMKTMRRLFESLTKVTDSATTSAMLNRYCFYFSLHQDRLSTWVPSSPFTSD